MFIALASTKLAFLLPFLKRFRCYGNFKVPFTYNGENENWPLLLCHCRYSDKNTLQKCSLRSPLPNISFLSKPLNLIGFHDNQKAKFEKKYSKIISSEAIRGIKLKLFGNVYNISLYKYGVFDCRCSCTFVAMAT